MIEILAHTASREDFIKGMTETALPDGTTLASLDKEGNLIPAPGVVIDEIGPITKRSIDENGNEVLTTIPGHHVNLRATGALADMLTQGLPQEGDVFERTHILSLIPGMEWKAITEEGVPAGYEGPNGVRLFDPGAVKNRTRVWL